MALGPMRKVSFCSTYFHFYTHHEGESDLLVVRMSIEKNAYLTVVFLGDLELKMLLPLIPLSMT
jgi:hypothetical protein